MDKNKLTNNIIGTILMLLAIVGGISIFKVLFGDDMWYDEIFSVVYSKHSYGEIVKLTAGDVHPPFYYFYLKGFVTLGSMMFPKLSYVTLSKLASFIPLIFLWIIDLTVIRQRYGYLTAGMFIFLITLMPQLDNYYVEIRMYSLCLLMVTICMLSVLEIISEGKAQSFFKLFIFGLLTAYTQYYACVAVVGIYMILMIYIILELYWEKKEENKEESKEENKDKNKASTGMARKMLWGLIINVCLSVVLYIPWLPSFIGQVTSVSQNYWIQPLTIRSVFGCLKFMYLPVSGDGIINMIMACAMIAFTFIIFFIFVLSKPDRKEMIVGISGIVILCFVIATGFILSIVNRPIFVYRYMIPVAGAYYLSLAYMTDYVAKKKGRLILIGIIVFVIGAKLNMNGFVYEENYKLKEIERTTAALSQIPEDSIIITNFDQVTTIADYYLNNKDIYLYEGETDNAVAAMFDRDNQLLKDEELEEKVAEWKENGHSIYFFGSFNSREEILRDWNERGISSEELHSVLLERYWFNIYKLW